MTSTLQAVHLFRSSCIAARTKLRIILNRILQLHVLPEEKQIKELSKIKVHLFCFSGSCWTFETILKIEIQKVIYWTTGGESSLGIQTWILQFLDVPKINKWEISGSNRFWTERNNSLTTSVQNRFACNVISATNLPDFFSHSEVLVHLDFQKFKCFFLPTKKVNVGTSIFFFFGPPLFLKDTGRNPRNFLI